MSDEMTPNEILDCVGLYCPEPLFQTRQKIDSLKSGEILEVLADDPAAEEDLKRLIKRTGNKLLRLEKKSNLIRFIIQKIN